MRLRGGSVAEPDVLLEARGLTRYFGALPAVDHLDFAVEPCEILGVIGPNGAGKTTMLNLISGLLVPSAGEIRFEGHRITGRPPHAVATAGIARTFQIVKPLRGLTVLENVAVGAMFGHRAAERGLTAARARAGEILEFVGLAARADAPTGVLTVADLKRLELARALAMEPRLLLLDEVMAGLNPREVGWVMGLVRQVRERGTAILMIEHVMKAIMEVSDRVLVLHHGRCIALGPPVEVSRNPQVIEAYLGRRYGAHPGMDG